MVVAIVPSPNQFPINTDPPMTDGAYAAPPRAVPVTAREGNVAGQAGPAATASVAPPVGGAFAQAASPFPPADRGAVGGPATDKTTDTKAAADKTDANGAGAVMVSVNPTFNYDAQSHRMVMITRDRKTGAVETQIPSQMALRQYDQAVKRVRDDVTAAQLSGSTPSTVSSVTAASLGIIIPFALGSGSTTVGTGSGRHGGARYNVVV